jgi:hypothetical protein
MPARRLQINAWLEGMGACRVFARRNTNPRAERCEIVESRKGFAPRLA